MNLTRFIAVAVLGCVASTGTNAQPTRSLVVDSVNKQMQRGAKPAKNVVAPASIMSSTAASKSTSGTTTKPARVVPILAITSPSVPTKTVRVAAPADSTKVAPPVRRTPIVAKNKPPAM
ncbi:MAG: hypothetical protein ABJB74_06605 [Gemmatimonas sp.]